MVVDLEESRKKIDEIDRKILSLFKERMAVTTDVAAYKRSTGKRVFDPVREDEKIKSLCAMVEDEFHQTAVEALFRQMMSISRKYQYQVLGPTVNDIPFRKVDSLDVDEDTRVVCFGEKGAFTEQAMDEVFGKNITSFSRQSFRGVMEAVANGEAKYGVLPIENTSTGGITDIYDLLVDYDVTIVAEHVIRVEQDLLGLPGATLEDIRKVYSHAQGLMQCADFLEKHPEITKETYSSTSGAAKKVADDGDKSQGAIASGRAAEAFGLEIIQPAINFKNQNYTRFIIISNQSIYLSDASKLCLCFEIKHQAGALFNMLANFYYNDLNLTKIESRPIENRTWEYRFFVELEGNIDSPGVGNALASVQEVASKLTVLGNIAKR